jgi:hypothetical protein
MMDILRQAWQQGTEAAAELIIAVLIFVWYIRHIINGVTQ